MVKPLPLIWGLGLFTIKSRTATTNEKKNSTNNNTRGGRKCHSGLEPKKN